MTLRQALTIFTILTLGLTCYAKKTRHKDKADTDKDKDSIAACLEAWKTHPFEKNPDYKTMSTSVKVFGVGQNPSDTEETKEPKLILINPAVNVMGSTTFELLNPNGWYCFKSNVNVMGGFTIETHCKTHLAFASNGATVLASANNDDVGVTVMGSTKVKSVECD